MQVDNQDAILFLIIFAVVVVNVVVVVVIFNVVIFSDLLTWQIRTK